MLAHEPIAVGAVADLSIRVPRSAPGDLDDGIRAVIEAVDSVTSVRSVRATSVTPNLNDLFVEVTAEVTVAFDEPVDDDEAAAVRSALRAGFGIDRVGDLAVDRSLGSLEND